MVRKEFIYIIVVTVIIAILILYLLISHYTSCKKHQKSTTDLLTEEYKKLSNKEGLVRNNLGNLPIYYINLNRSKDRLENMRNQFELYYINKVTRIEAIDGEKLGGMSSGDVYFNTKQFKYRNLSLACPENGYKYLINELACTLSHIKAIYTAYNNNEQTVIIMEDDIGFGLVPFWSKSIPDLLSLAPKDWCIISLFISDNETCHMGDTDFLPFPQYPCLCTVCYVISRKGMEDVLSCIKNDYILLKGKIPSDWFIFKHTKTYTYVRYPLFYLNSTQSTISGRNDLNKQQKENTLNIYLLNGRIKQCWESNNPIPKIIHQTWKTKYLPILFKEWSDEIKRLHPSWNYRLWTDEENRDFIKTHYPWFIDTYDRYDKHIKRVDAVRYFLLFHYGGIYMDMDMTCLKSMDTLLQDGKAIFGYQLHNHKADGSIANAYMACPPKHPLFEILIYSLNETKNLDVIKATGPGYLTNILRNYTGNDVVVHSMPVIYTHEWDDKSEKRKMCRNLDFCRNSYPNAFTTTFWTATWHGNTLDYELPRYRGVLQNPNNIQLIPRKIVKILITDDEKLPPIPEYLFKCVESWLQLNPEYEIFILDKNECLKFIKTYFPIRVLEAYNKVKPYAYKCDLARLCWLYINGGIYTDIRQTLLSPLSDIIHPKLSFMAAKDLDQKFTDSPLANGFIACTPRHIFIKKTINKVIDNILNGVYGMSPLEPTGPIVFGNTIRETIGGKGVFKLGIYTWRDTYYEIVNYARPFIYQKEKPFIKNKPKKDKFDTDIKSGNVYWQMWNDRDIYNE